MNEVDKIREEFNRELLPFRLSSGRYIKALADLGVTEIKGRPLTEYMQDWLDAVEEGRRLGLSA